MMLLSNYGYEFNNYLEHVMHSPNSNAYVLGCILLRFYFLWRSDPAIAGSVRAWCLTECSDYELRDLLLTLTADHAPTARPTSLRQWMVDPPNTVEDHLVPGERPAVNNFLLCLLRAEWIDLSFVLYRAFNLDAFESDVFAIHLMRGYYISSL
jgi:hypothetical protein